jgi:hypothetical protein
MKGVASREVDRRSRVGTRFAMIDDSFPELLTLSRPEAGAAAGGGRDRVAPKAQQRPAVRHRSAFLPSLKRIEDPLACRAPLGLVHDGPHAPPRSGWAVVRSEDPQVRRESLERAQSQAVTSPNSQGASGSRPVLCESRMPLAAHGAAWQPARRDTNLSEIALKRRTNMVRRMSDPRAWRILLVAAVVAASTMLSAAPASASACTVTGPVSNSFRDSWASAYRCNKVNGYGDALGVYSHFAAHTAEIMPACDGVSCYGKRLDFSLSAQTFDQYVAEGDDQLGAFARPDDAYSLNSLAAYWYYRRPGQPLYVFAPNYDCNGQYIYYDNDFAVGNSAAYWTMVVRREVGSETSTTEPTWRIEWLVDGSCKLRASGLRGHGYRTAEQWVNNDHGTISGDSRHRVRAYNVSYLDHNVTWRLWPEGQTGNSYGGYAYSGKVASYNHCLRTGNLGPTCP